MQTRPVARSFAGSSARRGPFVLGVALLVSACSSDSEGVRDSGVGARPDASAGASGDGGAGGGGSLSDAGTGVVIEVPLDSAVCGIALPLKPPGCACAPGETSACWTGPTLSRNIGDCKDGTQNCEANGEFGQWGACEGQVLDCGDPPAPPAEDCPCVPGKIIGCDEDCSALVFCAPASTKVCGPDGKFGACREALLPTADTNLFGCINVFFGCFAENPDGLFTGDCSDAFMCGHPPGAPEPTPATPPP